MYSPSTDPQEDRVWPAEPHPGVWPPSTWQHHPHQHIWLAGPGKRQEMTRRKWKRLGDHSLSPWWPKGYNRLKWWITSIFFFLFNNNHLFSRYISLRPSLSLVFIFSFFSDCFCCLPSVVSVSLRCSPEPAPPSGVYLYYSRHPGRLHHHRLTHTEIVSLSPIPLFLFSHCSTLDSDFRKVVL